jgi:hypothetical protein
MLRSLMNSRSMRSPRRHHRSRPLHAAVVVAAALLAACAEYLGTSFSEIALPEIAGRDAPSGARCWLETVNGAGPGAPWTVPRGSRVLFSGWAIDGATLANSDWLVVRLTKAGGGGRHYDALTWARSRRDDVGRELGAGPGVARAGFDLIGTLQQVPPGTYDIDVIIDAPGGLVSCATGRQLVAV